MSLRPTTILLMTHEFPPYPGGVGRYCWSLAAAASRAGFQVTVLAPDHSSLGAHEHSDPPGVEVIRFAGGVFRFADFSRLKRIVRSTLSGRAWDVIHLADWPMILALKSVKVTAARLVASLHGTDILLLRHSLRARLSGGLRPLKSFDRILCNSRFTASLLEGARSLGERCVEVAPLGVDAGWFDPPAAADVAAFRNRILAQPDDCIVLTVARLDDRKGHLSTIRALSLLDAEARARIRYVCVGAVVDESYREELVVAARAGGVRLVITGRIPDSKVRAAYATADVFALTARSSPRKVEGFGLVLLEAAAQGLPAVVTAVNAIPEVVVHGRTGWICDQDNVHALAHTLRLAIQSCREPALRANCVARARDYTWDRCAELTYVTER